MNNELIVSESWNGKDVRIENAAERKVNLVDVAKCCGLTKIANSGNEVVRWKGNETSIVGKLNSVVKNLPREFQEEVQKILIEIDESDDRNSIYVSNWLAQRIATECKSQTAMEFKNWLVTLNTTIQENNYVTTSQFNSLIDVINSSVTTQLDLMKKQTEIFTKEIQDLKNNFDCTMKKSIEENNKDREELKSFIGLKTSNVVKLSELLKSKISKAVNRNITGKDKIYKINRDNLLLKFNVTKWEDIGVNQYTEVIKEIKNMEILNIDNEEKNNKNKINRAVLKATENDIKINGITYRKCTCCNEYKELNSENFYYKDKTHTTLMSKCKSCKLKYYEENRSIRLKYQNQYARDNGIVKDVSNYKIYKNSKYSKNNIDK